MNVTLINVTLINELANLIKYVSISLNQYCIKR